MFTMIKFMFFAILLQPTANIAFEFIKPCSEDNVHITNNITDNNLSMENLTASKQDTNKYHPRITVENLTKSIEIFNETKYALNHLTDLLQTQTQSSTVASIGCTLDSKISISSVLNIRKLKLKLRNGTESPKAEWFKRNGYNAVTATAKQFNKTFSNNNLMKEVANKNVHMPNATFNTKLDLQVKLAHMKRIFLKLIKSNKNETFESINKAYPQVTVTEILNTRSKSTKPPEAEKETSHSKDMAEDKQDDLDNDFESDSDTEFQEMLKSKLRRSADNETIVEQDSSDNETLSSDDEENKDKDKIDGNYDEMLKKPLPLDLSNFNKSVGQKIIDRYPNQYDCNTIKHIKYPAYIWFVVICLVFLSLQKKAFLLK